MKKHVLFIMATTMMVLFQNCTNKVNVADLAVATPDLGNLNNEEEDTNAAPVTNLPAVTTGLPANPTPVASQPPTYEDLKMNCQKALAQGKIKKQILTARFPNPKVTCDWEKNGNYGYENDKIRARREQFQTLNLNIGAKVCSLTMKNVNQDKFFYDDNILLTLNGFVLASTSNFTQHLENKNGFYIYDWLRLRNQAAQNRDYNTTVEKQFCAGAAAGLASCAFPETETYGAVNLQFKDEVFQKILGMTNASQIRLGLITTGDNNPDTDCQHVDIDFSVEAYYYE